MNKNKIAAWILIAVTAIATFFRVEALAPATGAGLCAAAIVTFGLGALLTPLSNMVYLGTDNIDSELNLNAFLDATLKAFKAAILPLTNFATAFRNVQLRGTDKAEVVYYPIDSTAAKDFDQDDGYIFDEDTNTAHREITINKRKYVSMGISGRDLARLPMLNVAQLGALKGENLAYQIIQDILSLVTHANYATDGYVGSTFDSDNITDIGVVADTLTTDSRPTPWPQAGRGLVVNGLYNGMLLKDTSFKAAYAIGTDQVIRTGVLPNVLGFNYAKSPAIPDNGENLVGFASFPSAILTAFSPIEPPASVQKLLVDYRIVTDPESQISFEYRQWGDPDFDLDKRVIEVNYGYAQGEAKALLPIRSAAVES
jgi:hypothetical protein